METITNENGFVLEKLSFDLWGRRRDIRSWNYNHNHNLKSKYFDRGYTMHEHLNLFGLIIMNGRMYDLWAGRFLSPDPVVQNTEYGPNYNPYSYCLNKPLKYIDPSGYSWGGGDPPNNGSQSLGFFDWIGMVLMNVNFPGLNYSTPSIDFGGYQSTGNMTVLESGMNNAAAGSSYGFNFTYDFGFGSNGGFPGYNPAYEALAIPFISNEVYNQVQVDAKQDYGRDQNSLVYRNFVYRNNGSAGGGWDLNGDGRMTFNESYNWWKNGGGTTAQVPLSSLDLSSITPASFKNGVGGVETFNLLFRGNAKDGLVHGTISLRLYPNNTVKAFDGPYDFDYKPWLTNPIRNIENFFGKTIHGAGTPYEIDFTGSGTISPNPTITDWYMRTGGLR